MKIKHEYKSASSKATHVTTYDTDARAVTGCSCQGYRSPGQCWHVRDTLAKYDDSGNPLTANGLTTFDEEARVARAHIAQTVTVSKSLQPMLASAMTRGQTIERFGADWAFEQKYDGWRQITEVRRGVVVHSHTRAGKPLPLPPQCARAAAALPDGIYDGERVVPGGTSSDVSRADKQDRIVLVLFDVLELFGQSTIHKPYDERREYLTLAVSHIAKAMPDETGIALAASLPVSRLALDRIWATRGGEGAILKRRASHYQPGYRSPDWVKVKKEQHYTVTIVSFEKGDRGSLAGRTRVCDAAGLESRVKTPPFILRLSVAEREALIGRRAVIKANETLASGKRRHASFDHLAGEGE